MKTKNGNIQLFYHKTDRGAEYLMDTYIQTDMNDGSGNCSECGSEKHKEGVINDKTKYIVRIDGDITKDAELNIV